MSDRLTRFSCKAIRLVRNALVGIALALGAIGTSVAADFEPTAAQQAVNLDASSLEALAAPVALYPDELLAIVLPAATYPLQIVQAARFLEARKSDPNLEPNEQWDDSVVALLNYPEALALLNNDLDWTSRLGQAVFNQQGEIVQAISRFRERAQIAGNLESDDYKQVRRNNEVIEITSTSPERVYVPYYEPTQVIYHQSSPAYYYYPEPRPVYYYPYASNYYFGANSFWGVSTAFTIGWLSQRLYFHNHAYRSHPYYGQHYDRRHYRRHYARTPRHFARAPQHHNRNYRGDEWSHRRHNGYRPRVNSSRNHQPRTYADTPRQSHRSNNGSLHRGIKQHHSLSQPINANVARNNHRAHADANANPRAARNNHGAHADANANPRAARNNPRARADANANPRAARNNPRARADANAHGLGGAALASIARLPNAKPSQRARPQTAPARANKAQQSTRTRTSKYPGRNSAHAKSRFSNGKSRANTKAPRRQSPLTARTRTQRANNGALGNGAMAARSSRRSAIPSAPSRANSARGNRRASGGNRVRAANGLRGNGRRAMGIGQR